MTAWLKEKAKEPSYAIEKEAQIRQQQLTKPEGSLGKLEKLAIQLAKLQGRIDPDIYKPFIIVFSADHGVAEERISAFPQIVTVQMIQNFLNGGAAITILARKINADFQIVNLGTVTPVPEHKKLKQLNIGKGTKNFCREPSMSTVQLQQVLDAGKNIIDELIKGNLDLFIAGEMGIGNTTSATALACSLLQEKPENLVGRGTGIDNKGLQRKIDTIQRGLERHKKNLNTAEDCLCCLGGFEIAALTASYIRCAQKGIPVLIDGFICTVAALTAIKINPTVKDWFIYSHESAEAGHALLLNTLRVEALLNLNLRLGEGSGAAIAYPLLKLACALHNDMATFTSANVDNKTIA